MFKLVEKKGFFYFFACVTLILILIPLFVAYRVMNFAIAFEYILPAIVIICMMIFFDYEHKELVKALLTAFLAFVVFENIATANSYFTSLLREMNDPFLHDPIRRLIEYAHLLSTFIILTVMFINHFILNFNGKAKKIAIIVNIILVVLLIVLFVVDKCSIYVLTTKRQGDLSLWFTPMRFIMLSSSFLTISEALMIVSAEAHINGQRALKDIKPVAEVASKTKKAVKTVKSSKPVKKAKKVVKKVTNKK